MNDSTLPNSKAENKKNQETTSAPHLTLIESPTGPTALTNSATAAPGRVLFDIVTDTNLLAANDRPPEMLVDGLVEKQSLTMLCGAHGTGKTALLLSIGIAASLGRPLADQFQAKRARAVLVGFEASPYQYAKQLRKLLRGQGLESGGLECMIPRGADLKDDRAWERFAGAIVDRGYELVLIDGLNAMSSAEENSNTEMDPIMSKLVSLVEDARTVVFTHHMSKGGHEHARSAKFGSRGASCIPARCDAEWRVDLDDEKLRLTAAKTRGETRVGYVHNLAYEYDDESITIGLDRFGTSLKDQLAADVQAAGIKGIKRAALLAFAGIHLPSVPEDALEQRVERIIKSWKRDRLITHEGQGKPYVWVQ